MIKDSDNNSFGIVGMQTDNTLLLADNVFANTEEAELQKAGFLLKECKRLIINNPTKFNRGLVTWGENSLKLTQERHC
jgi:hypothetical protein